MYDADYSGPAPLGLQDLGTEQQIPQQPAAPQSQPQPVQETASQTAPRGVKSKKGIVLAAVIAVVIIAIAATLLLVKQPSPASTITYTSTTNQQATAATTTIGSNRALGNVSYVSENDARTILGLKGVYNTGYTANSAEAMTYYPLIGFMTQSINRAWHMNYTNITAGCDTAVLSNSSSRPCYTLAVVTYNTNDSMRVYDDLIGSVLSTGNVVSNGVTYSVAGGALTTGGTGVNVYALKGSYVVIAGLYTDQTVNQSFFVSKVLGTLDSVSGAYAAGSSSPTSTIGINLQSCSSLNLRIGASPNGKGATEKLGCSWTGGNLTVNFTGGSYDNSSIGMVRMNDTSFEVGPGGKTDFGCYGTSVISRTYLAPGDYYAMLKVGAFNTSKSNCGPASAEFSAG